MRDIRYVLALIVSVMILQAAGGILGVAAPLGLDALGAGPWAIGVIAALHSAGFMYGAFKSPKAIDLFGNIRVFAAAAAVCAVTSLLLGLVQDVWTWSAMRILQGVTFALMFTSAESWLAEIIPERSRGSVLGVYHTAAKLALMLGPFVIAGLAPLDLIVYVWIAIFTVAALVPVCLTYVPQPEPPEVVTMDLVKLVRLAPSAFIASLIAGIVNTGTLALLPVYTEDFVIGGGGTGAAAIAGAVAWGGGLILQWPSGKLSDRVLRRGVIAGLGVLAGVGSGAIALSGQYLTEWHILILLGVWGAGSLSFYGVAVAHAVDWARPRQIPEVMSGLLFVWAFGSIIGPFFSGLAYSLFGRAGLFGFDALLLLLMAAAMVVRITLKAPIADDLQEDWAPVQPTPLGGVELDPRAAGEAHDDPQSKV